MTDSNDWAPPDPKTRIVEADGAPPRDELIAEVLRERPELANAADAASLARLDDLVNELQAAYRTRSALEAVERARIEQERRLEEHQKRIQLENEERESRAAKLALLQEQRRQRLAAMSPARRWIATHMGLTVVISLCLATVVIASVAAGLSWRQDQLALEAAEAQAAASRAAVQAAAKSCDLAQIELLKNDEAALRAWLTCPDANVRQAAEDAIAFKFTYPIGSVGPGGGVVFYSSESRQPWGQFLEAAPQEWSGPLDPQSPWCVEGEKGYTQKLVMQGGIGSGAKATKAIVKVCGEASAAGLASSYRGGGLADWYLPDRSELKALFEQRWSVGGFSSARYWSSTQISGSASSAWYGDFYSSDWDVSGDKKSMSYSVRPIRAF